MEDTSITILKVDARTSQFRMPSVNTMAARALKTLLVVATIVLAGCFIARSAAASLGSLSLDPAFESGLPALRKATGFTEEMADQQTAANDLRLLIGVKAVEGAKRSLYFVELTTMRTSQTNSTRTVYTNRISWPGSESPAQTNTVFEFVYTLAPLRVRVFDENARLQRQGQALVPWELMTNSLADTCRICVALQEIRATPKGDKQQRQHALEQLLGGSTTGPINWAIVMRPLAGGVLTLGGLFAECLSTAALNDICTKAQCVIRLPGAWATLSTALGGKLDLSLDPRFLTDATVIGAGQEKNTEPLYRFPADLKNGKRKLVSVEFIVGPSTGAEVILAGIRSIRAVHPTRPDREFLAQVLAAGTVSAGR